MVYIKPLEKAKDLVERYGKQGALNITHEVLKVAPVIDSGTVDGMNHSHYWQAVRENLISGS